jgi:predicted GNAT family acetyltransferase
MMPPTSFAKKRAPSEKAMEVILSDDPAWVLSRAGDFLRSQPVLHNLILSLLHARVEHPEPGRYWVAVDGGKTLGVVFQSPLNFPATITPMEPALVEALVDAVANVVMLPGVNGEAGTAARFSGQWTERCKSAAVPVQGLRLYELQGLLESPPASGQLRKAMPEDRKLVVDWVRNFGDEVGEHAGEPELQVDQWMSGDGGVWLWEDDEPAAMAVSREPVERVVRVQHVYTPPEKRRRGYAGACVGQLSKHILDSGFRSILYTDLGNPTSNSIYRRIGYTAVAEALRYRFE